MKYYMPIMLFMAINCCCVVQENDDDASSSETPTWSPSEDDDTNTCQTPTPDSDTPIPVYTQDLENYTVHDVQFEWLRDSVGWRFEVSGEAAVEGGETDRLLCLWWGIDHWLENFTCEAGIEYLVSSSWSLFVFAPEYMVDEQHTIYYRLCEQAEDPLNGTCL